MKFIDFMGFNRRRKKMSEIYTFELNENVKREHVFYNNRYGIQLAADLYTAKVLDKNKKHPAIVVGPPYAGTKEQGPGVYANELAQRGFVVIAFDPCFMGESGGAPRHVSSPDIFSENFSAGVDFLGMLPYVDRERIGTIGICGSGGFSLSAAQVDTRIKAAVTCSLVDMSAASKMASPTELLAEKKRLNEQRWVDFENGYPEYIPAFPKVPADSIPEELEGAKAEYFSYYGMKRGHHPHALGNFTTTSKLSLINYDLLAHIDEISPRPILLIAGENAHSMAFSETVYANAKEPKELYIVPDAIHIDLYDDVHKIPFDKIENFFKENLK